MALRRSRILGWTLLAAAILVTAVLVVFHLQAVQESLWRAAAPRLAAVIGLDVRAGRVRVRLWPPHLDAADVELSAPGHAPFLAARSLQATWSWAALLRSPHRFQRVAIAGLRVDAANLPSRPSAPRTPGKVPAWPPVEVAQLEIAGGDASIPIDGIGIRATGLSVSGRASGERAEVTLVATDTELTRDGRALHLGGLAANIDASPEGARLREARLDGDALRVEAHGEVNPLLHDQSLAAAFSARVDLARVVSWWDPALQERIATRGWIDLRGSARLPASGTPSFDATGTGTGVVLAGYPIERLVIDSPEGRLRVTTDASWGQVTVGPIGGGRVPLAAELASARLDLLRALLPPNIRSQVPEGVTVSGTARGTLPIPVAMDELKARTDLHLHWLTGDVALAGSVDGRTVEIERLVASVDGASLVAAGRTVVGTSLKTSAALDVTDPAALTARLTPWLPVLGTLDLGGGPLHVDVRADGRWSDPDLHAQLSWDRPEVAARAFDHVTVGADGSLDALHLSAKVAVAGGRVDANGTGSVFAPSLRGQWTVSSVNAGRAAPLAAPERALAIGGEIAGNGTFTLAKDKWSVAASLHWTTPELAGWSADALDLELAATPAAVELSALTLARGPARLEVTGRLAPARTDGALQGTLDLRDLPLAALLPARDEHLAGDLGASFSLTGTLARPAVSGLACFTPETATSPLGTLTVRLGLDGGVVTAVSEELSTAAGAASIEAALPLGDIVRPAWLWPDAPSGPARLQVRAPAIRVNPLMEAFGLEPPPVEIRTGLELTGSWDPQRPDAGMILLALPGLELDAGREKAKATEVPRLRLEGTRLIADTFHLVGSQSDVLVSGWVDLATRELSLQADATVSPAFLRLLSPDLEVRRPLSAHAELRGPWRDPTGRVRLDHPGGKIILRDPPVEIADLAVEASVTHGVVDIDNGSASVNQGHVELAGGWNPAEQQGIVFQITDVTFLLPEGIFSQWDGLVALEPRTEGQLAIVGELELQRGLWDQDLDFTSLLLQQSGTIAPPPVSSPLEEVSVNLTVVAQGAIDVDNNLGSFQLRWQRLFVHGTLARPALEGQIRVMPNGELTLGGQPVQIARGTIDFPGRYGAEPQIEIVTETAVGGTAGEGTQATAGATQRLGLGQLAQAGLLKQVGGIVGLTNTRLQPIDIATETETNPATSLTVAQRFGPHVVFFLTTDLIDTSQRTGLLQFWNWRSLPGMAIQGFTSTTAGDGAAILERRSFGGAPSIRSTAPRLDKVQLEGSWPGDTSKLRKAIGLKKGQLFDPFMLFLGEVRLERALAERGYPDARVNGFQKGSSRQPRLEFTADPGPHADIRFTGDTIPEAVRRRVTSEYRFPPLEEDAIENMQDSLHRELAALGYPFARVTESRVDGALSFHIEKGKNLELQNLRLEGVPSDVAAAVALYMDSPVHLAALADANADEVARLERLLLAEGYPDARLQSAEIVPTGSDEADVRAVVAAGPRVAVDRVVLEGEDPLGIMAKPGFPLRPGVPLRQETVDRAAQRLRRAYQDQGYPDATVRTAVERRDGYHWNVRVTVEPGTRRRVGDVKIAGLRYLHPEVVKAGVTLAKGDLVSLSAIDQTAANLATFAPVQRVEVRREDQGDTSTIKIDVTEKPRWTVGAGVRYRSGTHEEYLLDLRDDDLLGRGLGVNLRGHWGRLSRAGRFLVSLPPLPGGRLAFDGWISGSHQQTGDKVERDQVITAEGRLYYGVSTQLRAYLQRTRTHVFAARPNPDIQESSVTLGTVGGQIVVDRRNDPFNPSSGWFGSLDVSYSPKWLRSDSQVVRAAGSYSYATSLGSDLIWAQGIRVGAAKPFGSPLPDSRAVRFYAGGETTVRGFDQDTIGPKDLVGDTLQPAGGGAQLIFNQELRYHLYSSFFLAAFADAGQVWSQWSDASFDLSVGAGLGVRVLTPIGPVRIDVAWPVRRKEGNHGAKLYFGIGQVF